MFRPCQGTHQRLITNAQYAIHMPFVTGRLCNWESSCDIWPDATMILMLADFNCMIVILQRLKSHTFTGGTGGPVPPPPSCFTAKIENGHICVIYKTKSHISVVLLAQLSPEKSRCIHFPNSYLYVFQYFLRS